MICTRCVMEDTNDPDITFDERGVCNYCRRHDYLANLPKQPVERIVDKIKKDGQGRPFDCVLGLSGGADSSYVAHLAGEWGLRTLVLHLDNCWDSEASQHNVKAMVDKLGFQLNWMKVDWEKFRSLQLAMIRSGTTAVEFPTDMAINAAILELAFKSKIQWVLTGQNYQTETHLPISWSYDTSDWRFIKAVARSGGGDASFIPHYDLLKGYYYKKTLGKFSPLNNMKYDKSKAIELLKQKYGWKEYGPKHGESLFTKWYQEDYLPNRFGVDKRRTHYSAMICSGQMSREDALERLKTPPHSEDRMAVLEKLGITIEEYKDLLASPNHSYKEFPSYGKLTGYYLQRRWRGYERKGK